MQAPELQRMALMQQLYGELLNQLIDERLLEQEARKLSVYVTSTDVDRAIENVQKQSGLAGPEFWDAVRAQGFVEDQYKADVRRQLLRLKVVNQKVRTRVNITEDDVRRKYEEQLREARKAAQFHVAHIFVPVEESTATQLAVAREKAEQVRGGLTPDTFDGIMTSVGGGDWAGCARATCPRAWPRPWSPWSPDKSALRSVARPGTTSSCSVNGGKANRPSATISRSRTSSTGRCWTNPWPSRRSPTSRNCASKA